MPDIDPRIELVVGLAQSEIASQFASAIGIDGRAVGLLAFDGALIAALLAGLAVPGFSVLGASWGYPLLGLVLSATLSLAAAMGGVRAGPELNRFYELVSTMDTPEEAGGLAVKDLIRTIGENRGTVRRKQYLLGAAVIVLALTPVTYVLYLRASLWVIPWVLGAAIIGALFVRLVWLSFTGGGYNS